MNLDVKNMMKLFYIIEMAKVVAIFTKMDRFTEITISLEGRGFKTSYNEEVFGDFVKCIEQNNDFHRQTLYHLYQLVQSYALVFLRKCTILMHVRYGVDFPSTSSDNTELARLSQLLLLPSLDELLAESLKSNHIRRLLKISGNLEDLNLMHPTIFELVGLPKTYDILQEEVVKRRCPTTGRLVSDPALCLFCGDIFCSQSTCCTTSVGAGKKVGGCFQHRLE
jgi:E3 ubiquitin-protein ligase UBR1